MQRINAEWMQNRQDLLDKACYNVCLGEKRMVRLVQSQETLQLDRPAVVLPLEEYQLLLGNAFTVAHRKPVHQQPLNPKLLKLLKSIQRESGETFTFSGFKQYLKKV